MAALQGLQWRLLGLEQGFEHSLATLKNISLIASQKAGSMPAQGVAVMTPPYVAEFLDGNDGLPTPFGPFAPNFPEWFDEGKPFPPWWPSTERSVQNAEASLVDAVVGQSLDGVQIGALGHPFRVLPRPSMQLFSFHLCPVRASEASCETCTRHTGSWTSLPEIMAFHGLSHHVSLLPMYMFEGAASIDHKAPRGRGSGVLNISRSRCRF